MRARIPLFNLLVIVFLSVAQCTSAWAASPKESVLYSFQGTPDGFSPSGRLAMDKVGNLYGTTWFGGTGGPTCEFGTCGTVFQLTPPATSGGAWTESVLYNFQGYTLGDGSTPTGGVIWGKGDKLYGVTAYGGSGPCTLLGGHAGCGTVYELTPPAATGGTWTETVIYSFQGGSDGYFGVGELVADKEGNLYGSTYFGGGSGVCDYGIYPYCGTVFELSPPASEGGPWTEKVLYSFTGGSDGAQPYGSLVLDDDGALYGTAFYGGDQACPGLESPGCGTIFKLARPRVVDSLWHFSVIHRFSHDLQQGANPWCGLIFDKEGNLYGTSYAGGGGSSVTGIVFQLSPPGQNGGPWNIRVLHRFTNNDGNAPRTGLVFDRQERLFGTTSAYGKYGGGTTFWLAPPTTGLRWTYGVLHAFAGPPDGAYPEGTPILGKGGRLYGVTAGGGTGTNCYPLTTCGVVYEIAP